MTKEEIIIGPIGDIHSWLRVLRDAGVETNIAMTPFGGYIEGRIILPENFEVNFSGYVGDLYDTDISVSGVSCCGMTAQDSLDDFCRFLKFSNRQLWTESTMESWALFARPD